MVFGLERSRSLMCETVVYKKQSVVLRKQTIVFIETDCCVLQTILLLIRTQTIVYKEVDFLAIYLMFSICSADHNSVLFLCKWTEGRGFALFLLLSECHSLTSSTLKWQQQKTKVFQSHV